ncbi:LuxR C-terminal-related transcriptional regulator [Dactylosporangium sp. NPDC051541]|uniref:LuxR C-terminal-related transcriptional regulator n=1 Tax=Dactylosporangium sp. NPDC051541 TaxID=3363977 RepID=UPI0037B39334
MAPLLERDAALAALAEYAAGAGGVVLVGGEAGVGKTALVEEFTRGRDRVAWGMCDGLSTPRPLGPLFDIAEQIGLDTAKNRDELFSAALQQITKNTDILVFEDLHWADEATIDLLRYLSRRLRSTTAICTYRDDGLAPGGPLQIALGDLGSQRGTRRISLAPLTEAAVRTLARHSTVDPAELFRLTGGNPYFVTELLHDRHSASARDAVLARAARLEPRDRTVLDTAALIGARVDPHSLAAEPASLDALIASGLLIADGTGLRFRHELARLTIEQAIPVHRRPALHAAILKTVTVDDARVAHHAEAAGDATRALHHAVRAARAASGLGAHREAAAQYQRAIRCGGQDDPELFEALAGELAVFDAWPGVIEAADRALELRRAAGDRRREGAALRLRSAAMVSLCRGEEAIRDAENAVQILRGYPHSPELAHALAHLATQRMLADRDDEAVDLARRAQAIAGPLRLHAVLSDAIDTEAVSLGRHGHPWRARIDEALTIALDHGCTEQAARAWTNLFGLLCTQRRYTEAAPVYAAAIAYCDDHDLTTYSSHIRGEWANALSRTGDWDQAVALCRHVLDRTDETAPINQIFPLFSYAVILARRGEPGVWAALDQATAAAEGSGEPQWILKARLGRAEAAWLEGRAELARTEAELADDAAALGDAWCRGIAAAWLRRTGSPRPYRDDLAEPFALECAGDIEGAAKAWRDYGCPYDEALALLGADTPGPVRRAVGLFDELGATAAARIARRRLRDLGGSVPAGPRTATRADPHGLTRREQEVLTLMTEGLTNAAIAGRLVLSVKTVDHHVSAILGKLGVTTRGQAVRKTG